jgi:trypsin-like peptidase
MTAELYRDTRMGGSGRWVFGDPDDANMRIPDDNLEAVVFLCVKVRDAGGFESDYFIGTGFFVSIDSTLFSGGRHYYLVTAKHVIEDTRAQGYSEFYVRINTADGKSITPKIPGNWIYSENPAVDVAVLYVKLPAVWKTPIVVENTTLNVRSLPADSFLTDRIMQKERVGVGDELFMVGLFNQRWGHQRNVPIVRTGIIASMPDEPFPDQFGGLYEGYLMETRSIGGLSGSPVFLYLDAWRVKYGEMQQRFNPTHLRWVIYVLGMVRSHWDLERQDAASDSSLGAAIENEEIDSLNTGIAVVTPIQEVHKILYGAELMKKRETAEQKHLQKKQPTSDSNLPRAHPEEFTRGGFEDALRKASRKISEPESKEKTSK